MTCNNIKRDKNDSRKLQYYSLHAKIKALCQCIIQYTCQNKYNVLVVPKITIIVSQATKLSAISMRSVFIATPLSS
jgi:hypothetical protein